MHSLFKNNNPYLFKNLGCAESSLWHIWTALAGACGLLLLKSVSSRAPGLSCPTAWGILVPQPGIKTTSPASQGRFSATGPSGRSWFVSFEMTTVHQCHGCVSGKIVELTWSSVLSLRSSSYGSLYILLLYLFFLCHVSFFRRVVSQHFLGHYHESK